MRNAYVAVIVMCLLLVAAQPARKQSKPTPATTPATKPSPMVALNDAATVARAAAADAAGKLDAAKAVVMERLRSDADYQQADRELADRKAALDAARAGSDMKTRLDAGGAFSKARAKVDGLAKSALVADANVRVATANKTEADKQLKAATDAIKQEEKREAGAEADREKNDPINVAIRNHKVVKGMTKQQAVEAMGEEPHAKFEREGSEVWVWKQTKQGIESIDGGGNPVYGEPRISGEVRVSLVADIVTSVSTSSIK